MKRNNLIVAVIVIFLMMTVVQTLMQFIGLVLIENGIIGDLELMSVFYYILLITGIVIYEIKLTNKYINNAFNKLRTMHYQYLATYLLNIVLLFVARAFLMGVDFPFEIILLTISMVCLLPWEFKFSRIRELAILHPEKFSD